MAIGTTKGAGIQAGTTPVVISGSGHGQWVQANDDARTSQESFLYAPGTITSSTFHWVRMTVGATGVCIRARTPIATTAVGTSPVVAIVGAYDAGTGSAAVGDPAGINDGTVYYKRLDSVGIADAGLTLTFPASPDTSNCQNDAAWFYSAEPLVGGYDCRGAKWVGVLVTTSGANTASAAMPIDIMLLNG